MNDNNLNSRREFLKKVCPTVAFAFFGLSFLEACSTDDPQDNNNNNNNKIRIKNKQSNTSYTMIDHITLISYSTILYLVE